MANTYLTRTVSSSGSDNKGTISFWVKRSKLGTNQVIIGGKKANTERVTIGFSTENYFEIQFQDTSNAYYWKSSAVYRDTFAWYNCVIQLDTGNSTATSRARAWINNEEITSWSLQETVPQNLSIGFSSNSNVPHVGARGGSSVDKYFDGLVSHLHFIDGTAYDASAFGETDATTGEWKAKTSPSVTYGTNGFFILKDGNGITDQSGEGNDFTLGGGTLTDLKDNPDNVFATLNPLSPQSYTFSNGNNTIARAGGTGQTTAIGTLAVNSGKWYWELKLNSGQSDYPRVGIYEMNSDNHIYTTHLGNASNGTGKWWGSGGTSSSNKKIGDGNSSTIEFYPYDNGDILMFALDCDNEKIWFGKNGTWYTNNNSTTTTGTAISNNTATPAFSTVSNSKLWIPAVFGNAGADNWSINFGNGYFGTTAVTTNSGNGYSGAEGSSKFNYTVPTGYSALSTKGLNE